MDSAYLIVQVSSRPCALMLQRGMEVLRLPELMQQQDAAAGLLGMAEIRGAVTPVLDLRVLLGLPASDVPAKRLVMLRIEDQPVALAVEAVIGVHRLAADQLETIALPQAAEQTVGRFDLGFARVIGTAGLVPAGLLTAGLLTADLVTAENAS